MGIGQFNIVTGEQIAILEAPPSFIEPICSYLSKFSGKNINWYYITGRACILADARPDDLEKILTELKISIRNLSGINVTLIKTLNCGDASFSR